MKDITHQQFIQSSENFITALELFTQENFNIKPFDKSWSAAQVAEHIFLSVKGLPQLFEMPTTEQPRDYAQHLDTLRKIFLNFDVKLDAPAFIIPSDKDQDKTSLVESLRNSFKEIETAVNTKDLTQVIADVPFPTIGPMSRYEWVWFTIFHLQRHTKQLHEIHRFVTNE